ncbi:hypothetical protein FRC96_08495 [Lujinxingia vulgaris]|uniref:Uncharacterized protein n=1 Tax=Lujinxingia vulgaris TaxID=2600176 RepID=A0A5C6XDL6_9DELT|nr:hypothetical protein FRC96_08495 [Lujinxingia vulgaris]
MLDFALDALGLGGIWESSLKLERTSTRTRSSTRSSTSTSPSTSTSTSPMRFLQFPGHIEENGFSNHNEVFR